MHYIRPPGRRCVQTPRLPSSRADAARPECRLPSRDVADPDPENVTRLTLRPRNGPRGGEPALATCRPWAGRLARTPFANSDVLGLPTDCLGVSGDLQIQALACVSERKAGQLGV